MPDKLTPAARLDLIPKVLVAGIDQVDNTRDADKPVSTAQQQALNLVDQKIAALLAGAPELYNTFKELADYVGSDQTAMAALLAKQQEHSTDITTLKTNGGVAPQAISTTINTEENLRVREIDLSNQALTILALYPRKAFNSVGFKARVSKATSAGLFVAGPERTTQEAIAADVTAVTDAERAYGVVLLVEVVPEIGTAPAKLGILYTATVRNVAPFAAPAFNFAAPAAASDKVRFSTTAAQGYLTIPLATARPGGVTLAFWCMAELTNPQGYWVDWRDAAKTGQGFFLSDVVSGCTFSVYDQAGAVANRNALTVGAWYLFIVTSGALGASSTITLLNRFSLNEAATGRGLAKVTVFDPPLTAQQHTPATMPQTGILAFYELKTQPTAGQTSLADTSGQNRTATIGGF